jgi:hypothetical protein
MSHIEKESCYSLQLSVTLRCNTKGAGSQDPAPLHSLITPLVYIDHQPLIDHMNMILRLQDAGAIPTLAEEIEVESLGPESQFIVSGQAAMDWLAGSNQLVAIWEAAGEDRNFKITPVPRAAGVAVLRENADEILAAAD